MVIDGGGGYVADGKDIEQHSNPGEGLAVVEGDHITALHISGCNGHE